MRRLLFLRTSLINSSKYSTYQQNSVDNKLELYSVKAFTNPTQIRLYRNTPGDKMADEVEKAQKAVSGGDTIFGKITRGEIQTDFLYKDDKVLLWDLSY